MKINQDTVLRGKKVTLVPYTAAHVPRYVPRALLHALVPPVPLKAVQGQERCRAAPHSSASGHCGLSLVMGEEQSFSTYSQGMFGELGTPTVCKVSQHKHNSVSVRSVLGR